MTTGALDVTSVDGLGLLPDWCRLGTDILIRPPKDVPDPRHKMVGEMLSEKVPEFIVGSKQVAGDCR